MFDPVRICEILNEEGVKYVLIGGLASVVHGSSLPTQDIDLVPARFAQNLERLARSLRRMNAMIRTSDGPVPAPIDARFLANMPVMLNLATDLGDLDLTFTPAGGLGGFEEWSVRALQVQIAADVSVLVASLDDIIDSKRAANRPKDRMALPYLESLQEELRNR
jgi:hypothetical protein